MNSQTFEQLLLSVGISFEGVSEDIKKLYLIRIEQNVKDKLEIVIHDQQINEKFSEMDFVSQDEQISFLKSKIPNLEEIVKTTTEEVVNELKRSL